MLGINTNLLSSIVQSNLSRSSNDVTQATERLSSGLRINSAKDDAAGLAIAARFETQIRGMNVAVRNANDAISLAQTAEGATDAMADILQRMRELAVQSANDSNDQDARDALDLEFQALSTELDRIATSTTFNGEAILAGDAGAKNFQVGANAGDTISITTTDLQTLNASVGDIKSAANAGTAMGALDTAIDTLNSERSTYGATMSRLDYTVKNLQNNIVNSEAARSRIMDADFAAETAKLTRAQILQQAGVGMLAQANQQPQLVLSLLR